MKLEEIVSTAQIYGPAEGAGVQKISEFYGNLQRILNNLRENNIKVIIMGDGNAKVGNETK